MSSELPTSPRLARPEKSPSTTMRNGASGGGALMLSLSLLSSPNEGSTDMMLLSGSDYMERDGNESIRLHGWDSTEFGRPEHKRAAKFGSAVNLLRRLTERAR